VRHRSVVTPGTSNDDLEVWPRSPSATTAPVVFSTTIRSPTRSASPQLGHVMDEPADEESADEEAEDDEDVSDSEDGTSGRSSRRPAIRLQEERDRGNRKLTHHLGREWLRGSLGNDLPLGRGRRQLLLRGAC
jgi:hypothetical protein